MKRLLKVFVFLIAIIAINAEAKSQNYKGLEELTDGNISEWTYIEASENGTPKPPPCQTIAKTCTIHKARQCFFEQTGRESTLDEIETGLHIITLCQANSVELPDEILKHHQEVFYSNAPAPVWGAKGRQYE